MALTLTDVIAAVLSFAVYEAIFVAIVIGTPKDALLSRTAGFALLTAAAAAVMRNGVLITGPPQRHAPLTGLLALHFLSLAEYIFLSRVDAATLSQLILKSRPSASPSADKRPVTTGEKTWKALALSFNARRLGTQWEAKNVHRRTPELTRGQFLLRTVPRVALCYLLVDGMMLAPPPEAHLVAPDKKSPWPWALGRLSGEDIGFRLAATVSFWTISYLIIYMLINSAACVSVAVGLSTPAFWPHIFGPMSALYTIRGFWGNFWHQRLRRTLTSFSDSITDSVLFIPRGTLLSRYTRIFLVFLISGLLHHPTDTVQGRPFRERASLDFFMMQPLGVMLEDAVQALTRTWPIPGVVRKVVGYAWVVFFLSLTTPQWMYSIARLGQSAELLPVSVALRLVELFAPKA